MAERYRKQGAVVRMEGATLIRASECGEAIEQGDLFTAAPAEEWTALPSIDEAEVRSAREAISAAVPSLLSIERLIVTSGVARHEYGVVEWQEETRRVHLAIVHRELRLRVLIDLDVFDHRSIGLIADTFARCEPERREAPLVRTAPSVSAALLSSLSGEVALEQASGGVDGRGQPITHLSAGAAACNWYRPTYRARPIRTRFNLIAPPKTTTEVPLEAPRAVALLSAPHDRTVLLLCSDGDRAFPVELPLLSPLAIASETTFFPYGAGAFGSEMLFKR